MGFQIMGMDLACVFDALGQASFPANDCLMPLLSKFLGYCIVITSFIVKVPQIYVIMKGKSVRGLSQSSFELEVVGYTIALAYCLYKRLPFSAYGELVFLLIQALILIALVYYYSRAPKSNVMSKTVLYCAVAPVLFAGRVDPALFEVLYASQHAIFFFSRLPQIYENFKNKNTGQLSFPTNFMGFGGCVVRFFTSIQESAPTSMIVGSILGFITNGVVVSQILLYGNKDGKRKEN